MTDASSRSTGDLPGALAAQAVALIERMGATTLAPYLHERRAELALVLGDEAEHVRLLDEAQQGYAAIGRTWHAERILRATAA